MTQNSDTKHSNKNAYQYCVTLHLILFVFTCILFLSAYASWQNLAKFDQNVLKHS